MDLCLIFSTPLLDFVATFLNLPCAIPLLLLLLLLLCRYKVLSRKLCVLSKITNKQENNKASFPFILLVLLVLLLLVVVKYK
jgi:ABC-type methionine transport system permease subunit